MIVKNKSSNIKKVDWNAVDSPPLSEEMLTKMKPVKEKHPDIPKRVRIAKKDLNSQANPRA